MGIRNGDYREVEIRRRLEISKNLLKGTILPSSATFSLK